MLEGYKINEYGVIEQIDKTKKISYDVTYSDIRYNTYGPKVDNMSYLRIGFIHGAIGRNINSILDVGYGNGSFLKVCKNYIPKCYGNDISGYPIPTDCIFVENITDKHYDVITFFDSLEHFDNIDFVKNLKCNYVCISLPWCHYYSDTWFKEWKHRRPGEHLFHFNSDSLDQFMLQFSFKKKCNSINIEDIIRKSDDKNNILTALYEKL